MVQHHNLKLPQLTLLRAHIFMSVFFSIQFPTFSSIYFNHQVLDSSSLNGVFPFVLRRIHLNSIWFSKWNRDLAIYLLHLLQFFPTSDQPICNFNSRLPTVGDLAGHDLFILWCHELIKNVAFVVVLLLLVVVVANAMTVMKSKWMSVDCMCNAYTSAQSGASSSQRIKISSNRTVLQDIHVIVI